MFLTLLSVTFIIAFVVSSIVVLIFSNPIEAILGKIVTDKISKAWWRYLIFAIYVTGVASGVRIWDLEKYITKRDYEGAEIIELTLDRWILELYRAVISTLQGVAWMLLVFFVFALIAYAFVRAFDTRRNQPAKEE